MYRHSVALPSLVSDAAVAVRQRVQPEWHLICSACFWKPTGMTRPYSILLRDAKMASKLLENWLKCSNTMSLTVIITMPMMITMRQDISSDEKQHEQNQEVASGGGGNKSKDETEKRSKKLNKESAKQAIFVILRDVCVGFARFVTWSSQSCCI